VESIANIFWALPSGFDLAETLYLRPDRFLLIFTEIVFAKKRRANLRFLVRKVS